jgi:hypothetical protein
VPRPEETPFRDQVDTLHKAVEQGQSQQPEGESGGWWPFRSETARPSSSARPQETVPLTGEELAAHRQRRAEEAYDPTSEQQFNTDAKDLKEWAFQEQKAAPNSSDQIRATARKEEILERYRNLGRNALTKAEPSQNYPRTNDPDLAEPVDELKEAFKEGYRESQG